MNLVKADWYRIRKEKLSLVSLAILIVLSLILAYSSSQELTAVGAQDILSNWTNLLPLFFYHLSSLSRYLMKNILSSIVKIRKLFSFGLKFRVKKSTRNEHLMLKIFDKVLQ
ncbi:hypothetical protein [Streptococcus suis]|uniref:hypothetical protein n=1 Tax=Streptococcus suis TaxID=1307 RepID=UPI001375366F|nr:hypothetical protein [Streptococcus suis]